MLTIIKFSEVSVPRWGVIKHQLVPQDKLLTDKAGQAFMTERVVLQVSSLTQFLITF